MGSTLFPGLCLQNLFIIAQTLSPLRHNVESVPHTAVRLGILKSSPSLAALKHGVICLSCSFFSSVLVGSRATTIGYTARHILSSRAANRPSYEPEYSCSITRDCQPQAEDINYPLIVHAVICRLPEPVSQLRRRCQSAVHPPHSFAAHSGCLLRGLGCITLPGG